MKSAASHNSERLLHTKLMPPRLPSTAIQREELLARLDVGLAKKVSLVSAPPGFGKTTLVRMWIHKRMNAAREGGTLRVTRGEENEIHPSSFSLQRFKFAWATLDDHDNDPIRFWTYACSALRTLDPSLGKANYVSPIDGEITQFGMPSQFGNVGLLAHIDLSGRFFSQLAVGQEVRLVYGNGKVEYFVITQILQYQALQPNSPYSIFRDLSNDEK